MQVKASLAVKCPKISAIKQLGTSQPGGFGFVFSYGECAHKLIALR